MSKYYVHVPGEGIEIYNTAEEAQKIAEECLDHLREEARKDEGWFDDTHLLEWGELKTEQKVQEIKEPDPSGRFDHISEFVLVKKLDPSEAKMFVIISDSFQQCPKHPDAELTKTNILKKPERRYFACGCIWESHDGKHWKFTDRF